MFVDTPSSSGIVQSADEKLSAKFTDYTELPCKGFNLIYKAKRYGKWHILKGLKPEFRQQPLYQELLCKEFELGVMLVHPNIVTVMGFEQDDRLGHCIVMEYVDGVRLSDFLENKPPRKLVAKVFNELLSAMSYFHSKQVVHRDLKPSNILVTHNGNNIKIIDFGLSDADSYVVLKQPAGSLRYAAPEQLQQGVPVDCRTDIYAFGKILEYDFPHRYNWLAKKCAKPNPEYRPDNAAEVLALHHRHRLLKRIVWVLLALTLTTVGALLLLPKTKDAEIPKSTADASPVEQSAPAPEIAVSPEKNESVADNKSSNDLDAQLKSQLEREMFKRFHPLMQDIKNNKYEWRDEAMLVRDNIIHDLRNEVLTPVLQQVPPSSTDYAVCSSYYVNLYNRYWDSVKTLSQRLPSYEEKYMTLTMQFSENKISAEEYQQKMQELGPDPRAKWTYNQTTKLWSRKP